jgi:hypothetical protein
MATMTSQRRVIVTFITALSVVLFSCVCPQGFGQTGCKIEEFNLAWRTVTKVKMVSVHTSELEGKKEEEKKFRSRQVVIIKYHNGFRKNSDVDSVNVWSLKAKDLRNSIITHLQTYSMEQSPS